MTPASTSASSRPRARPRTSAMGQKIYTLFDVYPTPTSSLTRVTTRFRQCLPRSHLFRQARRRKHLCRLRGTSTRSVKTIEISQLVTRETVDQVGAVLHDRALRDDRRTNFALGLKYPYAVARRTAARLAKFSAKACMARGDSGANR